MSEVTKVIFRKDETGEVTAVFPEVPDSCENWYSIMSCYSHIGQHSQCCKAWYQTTKPATPEEYASLKRELESVPYEYKLEVVQKITRAMDEKRKLAWQSWQKAPANP